MPPSDPYLLSGIHYQTNEPVELTIHRGLITHIAKKKGASHGALPFVGPGLVDLQVNGFRGMDFNSPALPIKDVEKLTQELWTNGVTSFCPTVITNSDANIRTALRVIKEACEAYPAVGESVAGIHLEGPFISPEDGPRGAHGREHVKAPDWQLLESFQEAAGDKIKIITLSPEWPGSVDFIRHCVKSGLVVSIGHTAATPNQIREAVEAGARMSTHLGNGSHLMLPRHPNYIWEQLAQDSLAACVIADGFHLPDAVLKVIFKVKQEQAILVSDSVSLAGMPPGPYRSPIGDKVVLTEEGRLHLMENPGILAGSAQTLLWGIQHILKKKISTLAKAWDMASVHPLQVTRLPQRDGLRIDAPADLVLFAWNGESIQILQTFKNGKLVYQQGQAAPPFTLLSA